MAEPRYPLPTWILDKDTSDELEAAGRTITKGTYRCSVEDFPHRIEVYDGAKWRAIVVADTISRGATVESPIAASIVAWRAPFAATAIQVRAYQNVGTGSVVNAYKGTLASPSRFLASNLTISSADAWVSQAVDQNAAIAAGDTAYIEIVSVAGSPNRIAIQIDTEKVLT